MPAATSTLRAHHWGDHTTLILGHPMHGIELDGPTANEVSLTGEHGLLSATQLSTLTLICRRLFGLGSHHSYLGRIRRSPPS